jgi:hypothetical protein
VSRWYHQHVSWIHRLDIHECGAFSVTKKKCRGKLSRQHSAENAVAQGIGVPGFTSTL